MWLCHLSHDPLAATSLDHLHTLVQQGYNNVQVTYKNVARPSQKQVDKLNYKTMTTGKLLQTEPNESTRVQLHASDIKLVSSENS